MLLVGSLTLGGFYWGKFAVDEDLKRSLETKEVIDFCGKFLVFHTCHSIRSISL